MMKIGAIIITLAVLGMLADTYNEVKNKKPPAAQQQTAQQKQQAQQKQ
jgi:uncharacterized membrane protein YdfJ with MMPL/SSD domain